MPWTPLHAALGDTSPDLDLTLIERACESKVRERADLDWKERLPLTAIREDRESKQRQQQELAKDIAAMANSGGGMIVYGVAEVRQAGTSAADRIEPVGAVDEDTLRAVRQVAGNLVYPPVTGLDLFPLAPVEDPDAGVLVLLVPDSPEAPHLIHSSKNQDWFGAPYRHGPDTEWMVERQLSSAYAARETARRRRADDFDARFGAFTSVLEAGTDARWVVAMAVPEVPLSRPRDLQFSEARQIIDHAWSLSLTQGFGPRDLTASETTRRGLQRFIRVGRRDIQAAPGAVARARVEVHGDGTVAVAFTRDGALSSEGRQAGQVPVDDIESTAVELFQLLWAARNELRTSSDYTARLTVHPPTQIFRRPDPTESGRYQPWDEHRVYGYVPVEGPVLVSEGLESALESWVALVSDAVNQAGSACSLDVDQLLTRWWTKD